MPALRAPPTLSLLSRASTTTSLTHLYPTPLTRSMSSSSHGSHYDPPTGWFLGVPPGEKQAKEGWEGIWYWGFFGGLFAAGVAYAYKPDTSIQSWALEEARRRLEAEGIIEDSTKGQKSMLRTVSGSLPPKH
ncbi:ESSS subunit of NADH:ubiquinone oxidoreductase-domain-containing protein [Morchella snyderi]|nr:ESSS subunit of NADH:ubiquinone oxidoreductase-domain-containing protein [Morchella snyderi]